MPRSGRIKHGYLRNGKKPAEYIAWYGMKQRCFNPNREGWKYYGGRGITVCEEWKDNFAQFLKNMGPKPTPRHSLDRKNNDGNYHPQNCRWASKKEQVDNRRKQTAKNYGTFFITIDGITKCALAWSRVLGYGTNTVSDRYKRGWRGKKLLITPRVGRNQYAP